MYTVKELIETLKQCPQDYEVLIDIDLPLEVVAINNDTKIVNLLAE